MSNIRDAESRIVRAAIAFAEASKKISYSISELPSGVVHEIYEAVCEWQAINSEREATSNFHSWYESIYKKTYVGSEQQAVIDMMKKAYVAGWNKQ